MKIKIGTRGSKLALVQAELVKNELQKIHRHISIEIIIIKTTGDKILDSPLSQIGDKGLFTKEIEKELLANTIDLAVHSMKDMPTSLPVGLEIGAVTRREDPHDVFISKNNLKLKDLKDGDIIATSSLRRRAQLLHFNEKLKVVDIRGSVQTRIAKIDEDNEIQGIILAHAGLARLGIAHRLTEVISKEIMLPAVGQAALAIEVLSDNVKIKKLLAPLNHEQTAKEISCERNFLRILEGGCQVPIGGYAWIEDGTIFLTGMVASLDGKKLFRETMSAPENDYEKIAENLAVHILSIGAKKILQNIYRSNTEHE